MTEWELTYVRREAAIAEGGLVAIARPAMREFLALYDAVTAAYPGRTLAEIIAGLTVPACRETKE